MASTRRCCAVGRLTVPSDEKRTPLTKWMPKRWGLGWVRHYDGAIIYESGHASKTAERTNRERQGVLL